MSKGTYRRDIDGLRSLAVAGVVFYHSNPEWLPGGFVGVDVFFVISGYLITSLLLAEIGRSGGIDFAEFYARRIRRLFPALAVVVFSTLIAGLFLLDPLGQLQSLSGSAIATVLYVSNFYFWKTTGGYFQDSAESQPLLHMWSLSVEEQFYLVWPLMLFLLARVARARGWSWRISIILMMFAVLAGSLAMSIYGTSHFREATFFLMPTRAWEFMAGALLALIPSGAVHGSVWMSRSRSLACCLGAAAVIVSMLLFDDRTPFPGFAAMVPVTGAALIIFSGLYKGEVAVSRLLESRLAVRIGVLSYSWYLWHWPLLVLARVADLGSMHPLRDLLIALISLGLADLTYRFVETPLRHGTRFGFQRPVGVFYFAVGFCMLSTATAQLPTAYARELLSDVKYQALVVAKADFPSAEPTPCLSARWNRDSDQTSCVGQPEHSQGLLLLGDSHAAMWRGAIDAYVEARGMGWAEHVRIGCPPLLSVFSVKDECVQHNHHFIERLSTNGDALKLFEVIVVSARWTAYAGALNEKEKSQFGLRSYDGRTISPDKLPEVIRRDMDGLAKDLLRSGVKILLVAPGIEFPFQVPQCLAHRTPADCSVDRSVVEKRRESVLRVLKEVEASNPNVSVWDPLIAECPQPVCMPMINDVVLMRDDDHLTGQAANVLAPSLARALDELYRPFSTR